MLTHNVIWKNKPDTTRAEREEHVARLRRLPSLVDGIESFAVGFDVLHLARSFDMGLVAVFSDRTTLDRYTLHPAHIHVAEFGRAISSSVASVDFEDGGR